MKKCHLFLALFAILLMVACGSYYSLVRQTTPTASLNQYGTISLGWLNLDESKWKEYGFAETDKGKWETLVLDLNQKSLPQYLKDFAPGKTILMVNSKTENPKNEGLVVKFTDVVYNQQTSSGAQIMFGSMAGSDTLDLTVRFIDGQSGQELDAVTVSLQSKAGTGYSQWGFEGRVTNSVYNLARYISERIR
jgi:hypothetical protein